MITQKINNFLQNFVMAYKDHISCLCTKLEAIWTIKELWAKEVGDFHYVRKWAVGHSFTHMAAIIQIQIFDDVNANHK